MPEIPIPLDFQMIRKEKRTEWKNPIVETKPVAVWERPMRRKITYKLTAKEADACLKFAADMGMELNQLAKKSLFYALTNAYRTATTSTAQPQAGEDESHNESPTSSSHLAGESDEAGAGVDQTTDAASSLSTNVDSPLLAEAEGNTDTSK